MTKYTAQQVIDEKISFKNLSIEEYNKLAEHFQKLCPEWNYSRYVGMHYYHRFYGTIKNPVGTSSESYVTGLSFTQSSFASSKEITFDEFDFEELYIGKIVILNKHKYSVDYLPAWGYYLEFEDVGCNRVIFEELNINGHSFQHIVLGYNIGGDFPFCKTLEDLTKFINAIKDKIKEQPKMEETKKLIGWRIKPECVDYTRQAANIAYRDDTTSFSERPNNTNFNNGSFCHTNLVKAGLLDIWFEPVYKEVIVERVISMNEKFSLTVKKSGIFHNGQDITNYVRCVIAWYKNLPTTFEGFDFIIGDVTLNKTGCMSEITKINDWINVYEVYEKFKMN